MTGHRCGERCALPSGACVHAVVEERGPMTLEAIAEELGVSRERVRQIEGEAIGRLRRRLRRAGLELDDVLGGAIEELAA